MNASEQLKELRTALDKRGVQDTKFCFKEAGEVPFSHLQADVTAALNAIIAGRVHPLPAMDDSVRK